MKPFGSERFMGIVPLVVLVVVAMVLAGGPGPLLNVIDRLVSQTWAVVSAWFGELTR